MLRDWNTTTRLWVCLGIPEAIYRERGGPVYFSDTSSFYRVSFFYNCSWHTNHSCLMMSLMIPVSYTPDDFYFYRIFCFYIFCHQTNQIRSMMNMTNLEPTPDPLVRTLLDIFLCILMSPLLVFWGLIFLHQREFSPKVVDSLHSFCAQIPNFPSKFQNLLYGYSLTFHSLSLQPL